VADEPPLLTLDAVRDWVGDFEIGKGRPYAETAVIGERVIHTQISACVRGTRPRPYHVNVGTAGGAVVSAECTCPVGESGKCKHVAAVLLAYVGDPWRFAPLQAGEPPVHERSQSELVALVNEFLIRAIELAPVLAEPLPGFARGSTDPEPFRRRAGAVLRAWNPADDHGGQELEVALSEIAYRADQFDQHGERETANAVREGLRQAIRDYGPARLAHVAEAIPECARGELPAPPAGNEPPF
jgi:hypothetical protein